MRAQRLISQIGPLIMLVAGLSFALGSVATLDLGSLRRMGPGAFPMITGGLLALLAAIALAQNLRGPMPVDRADPVAVMGVTGGVASFALFTPLLGVLPATAVAVFVTGSAIPGFRWPHKLLLSAGVALAVWLIFVVGLGMPFTAIRGL